MPDQPQLEETGRNGVNVDLVQPGKTAALLHPMPRISRAPQACFLSAAALFILAGLLALAVYPCFRKASYSIEGAESVDRQWPFYVPDSPAGFVTWTIPFESPLLRPGALALYGVGHLHAMEVNGHKTTFSPPKVLESQTPARISLGGQVRPGNNILKLTLEKAQGKAALRPALDPLDPPHLVLLGVALAGCGALLAGIHLRAPGFLPASLAIILLFGISVRVLYTSATVYSARAYDTPGHVEYIKYVATEAALPPALMGWETHQPPLYYAICAGVMRALGMESSSYLYAAWQFLSLLLAVGAFLLCYPICLRLLGPPGSRPLPHALFLGILAVYPGFVFTSSRISNDSLFNFLAFLWFWLVLRAWQQPGLRGWIFVSICLGLGVLTKNTMLPLLAVSVCLALCLPRSVPRKKALILAVMAGAIFLLSGWYQLPRLAISNNPTAFIAANHDMGPGLRIPRSLDRMATFNPAAVIAIPFHNTWKDESRRMFLAEAFFKSSLFGEWVWGGHLLLIARVLVISAMALLFWAVAGFVLDLRSGSPNFLSVLLTAGAVFGSVPLYFWKLPYACNQDFRFAILLLVPMAFWIAKASTRWPGLVAMPVVVFGINAMLFLAILAYI